MGERPEVRRPDDEVERNAAAEQERSQRELDRRDDQGGDAEGAGSVEQREAVAADDDETFDR